MKNKRQVITHPAQLNGLSVLPGIRTPGAGRIVTEDERVDSKTRSQWDALLNKHYFACGCDKAAVGMLIGVIAAALWYFAGGAAPEASVMMLGLTALGIVVALTVTGKFAGLMMAQRKLDRVIQDIQSAWKAPETAPDSWTCG